MIIELSKNIIISDPCYDYEDTNKQKIKAGVYNVNVVEGNQGEWGDRILSIELKHKDLKTKPDWENIGSIGVDSGQAGIFCETIYPKDTGEYNDLSSFYRKCCNMTMKNYKEYKNWYNLKESIRINDIETSIKFFKEELEVYESLEKYLVKNKYSSIDTIKLTEIYNKDCKEITEWLNYNLMLYQNYLTTKVMPEKPKLIQYGIIDNKGIVSSSGFGDGFYPYFGHFEKGKCVAIKIQFI